MKILPFLLPLFAAVAFAADETATKPAESGPTKSARWIQGEAPESWEPGKLYVIECWATWCGPCVAVIPHMNELFKKHSKDGLRVVGMNVWENHTKTDDPKKLQAAAEKAFKKASDFVKSKGDGMSYPVAFASRDGDFTASWLKAAGVRGIPHAFVVKDGKLLFTTHPGRLDDEIITALLAGGDAQTKAIEGIEQQTRNRNQIGAIMSDFRTAQKAKDAAKMAEAIAQLEKLDPKAPFLSQMHLDLAIASKDWGKAIEGIDKLGTGPGAAHLLGSLAFRVGADPDNTPANVRKTIADQFARALEKSPANPTGFILLSRLYWTLDDKEAASKAAHDATTNCGVMPAAPFEKFAKSVEAGEPMPIQDVFTRLREAMMKQAREKADNIDKELKKNIEKKQEAPAAKQE